MPFLQNPGNESDYLLAVKQKILPPDVCEEEYYRHKTNANKTKHIRFLKKYEICVKRSKKTTCKGDSGGPLVCEEIHGKY